MKKKYRIFPDYCSSGMWDYFTGANVDPEAEGVTDKCILLALKYWHWTWEFAQDKEYNTTMSDIGMKQWKSDGEAIVQLLNEKYGATMEFS